jgi:hypothetical protein
MGGTYDEEERHNLDELTPPDSSGEGMGEQMAERLRLADTEAVPLQQDPKDRALSDARATVETAITDAFAKTADVTGLRSGPGTDQLRDALIANLFDSPYRWAVGRYFKETETTAP